ncbi:phosphosulfolactate synthase [Lactovum odontotermitis]
MLAYDFLDTKKNSSDSNGGKTMVMDKNLGLSRVDDLLATAGNYISFVKFGWGTSATMNRELVQAKTEKYREAGIIAYPGGTLLEIAVLNDKFTEFLNESKELGFTGIEVSDGSTKISSEQRAEILEQAREAGFFVLSEVGKKNPLLDHEFTVAERLTQIKDDLANGAEYVILEAREAGKNIGIYDKEGAIITAELDALATVGVDKLIFEAPLKDQQVELILKYGPNINLGNISTDDVTALETLRRGLRGDTIGRV